MWTICLLKHDFRSLINKINSLKRIYIINDATYRPQLFCSIYNVMGNIVVVIF